jgi:AcrR family transcriptional regulator
MYTKPDPPNATRSVRLRLLEGAASCLREKGYVDTTARDIAAAAEANLRSIGYHFGSTNGLLLAAISLNFRRWLDPLIAVAGDEDRPAAERLEAGMAQFAVALGENSPMLRAWLEAIVLAAHDEELRRTLAENQLEFCRALTSTLAEAGSEEPELGAAAIISICDGLIVRFMLHGESGHVEDVAIAAGNALRIGRDGDRSHKR